MEIYYDSIQEGLWFQSLHPILQDASLLPFPSGTAGSALVRQALSYDRPDIILSNNGKPILVLERTVEVPTGHNVGQRFARLVAAAQMRVPLVYFGPYAAYKHGGQTQGPRYMNLRLFYALKAMARIEHTAITVINWPVDRHYEIIQDVSKDTRVKEYLELFFRLFHTHGLPRMIDHLTSSAFEQVQEAERAAFIAKAVARPTEYDFPPPSVRIGPIQSFPELASQKPSGLLTREIVLYDVGMTYVRSDPYTGTALLYAYLYCGGMASRTRNLVLHFPNISQPQWQAAAGGRDRKDIRLYKLTADGILFSDGFLSRSLL